MDINIYPCVYINVNCLIIFIGGGKMALARKLKIVVACGSGIATSTVAGLKIESLCK
jgi:hypothetical protein